MFPHLEVSFHNLDPGTLYAVEIEMVPCDGKRYKFLKTEWVPTGRAEKKQTLSVYEHPDSPNTGSFWMSKAVTFKMVKLTNNKMTKFKDQVGTTRLCNCIIDAPSLFPAENFELDAEVPAYG